MHKCADYHKSGTSKKKNILTYKFINKTHKYSTLTCPIFTINTTNIHSFFPNKKTQHSKHPKSNNNSLKLLTQTKTKTRKSPKKTTERKTKYPANPQRHRRKIQTIIASPIVASNIQNFEMKAPRRKALCRVGSPPPSIKAN